MEAAICIYGITVIQRGSALSRSERRENCNFRQFKQQLFSYFSSIAQFLSAFLLLGAGTLVSVVFLAFEHLYMTFLQESRENKIGTWTTFWAVFRMSFGQGQTASIKLPSLILIRC